MTHWDIPQPIPIDWEMRKLDSASITWRTLPDGRFEQVVEHAPLPGVTPAMCLWYLENIDRVMTWRGHTALAYRFWHPVDHIYFKRLGEFGAGDRWHIVEMFGGERRFLLDQIFHVTELDETGFKMEVRRLGEPVSQSIERWRPTPEGLRWSVEMIVGFRPHWLRPISRIALPRLMPFLIRWRQHNVEEAGNLPHFLPELYVTSHA